MSDNYQYVPCGTCRGAKFMMKLGGIYGECNTCGGSGEVKQKKINIILQPALDQNNSDAAVKIESVSIDTRVEEEFDPPSKRLAKLKKDKVN